jgi:asparagine synthetase B (glutamine-hydrolysing)
MKVRIKELAQEAKFIRLEETKAKKRKNFLYEKYPSMNEDIGRYYSDLCSDLNSLKSHRKVEVREAARAAQLAYAFLREIPYSKIENKRKLEKEYRFDNYIKPEIKRLAKKFGKLWGKENYDEEIEKWLTL